MPWTVPMEGSAGVDGGLVDDDLPGLVVDVDEVGEGAADVDSDSPHSISFWSVAGARADARGAARPVRRL